MKILLIEDDLPTQTAIEHTLIAQHYQVSVASDGLFGLALAQQFTHDLILLDWILPLLDGTEVCKKLRHLGCTQPILLLTAKDSATDRVIGLDAGADDYLVKPFEMSELLARIRALLRRGQPVPLPVITWENLYFDAVNRQFTVGSQVLRLTPKEYGLLELLLLNPKRIFSRSNILDCLWDFSESPGEETVSTHIKCLRQKLKSAGVSDPIETVHGLGYRLKSPTLAPSPLPDSLSGSSSGLPTSPHSLDSAQQKKASNRRKVLVKTRQVWMQSQDRLLAQLEVLTRAAEALQANQLTQELRQQAMQEAHKLTGSLGVFDLLVGSQLARQIEDLLQPSLVLEQSQAVELSEWVEQLRQELQKKNAELTLEANLEGNLEAKSFGSSAAATSTTSTTSTSTSTSTTSTTSTTDLPLLLIVAPDQSLTSAMQADAAAWNFRVEGVAQVEQVRQIMAHSPPQAILLDATDACFQASVLQELQKLREIMMQPAIPVLALTEQSSLENRLVVARSGGCTFLHQPLSNLEIFSIVADVLRRNQVNHVNRILLVDDDVIVLDELTALLLPFDVEVVGLSSPHQFWQVLTTTIPNLLVLDLEMPGFSGIELAQAVRIDPQWRDLQILFLSTHTEAALIERAFAAGADDYVSKSEPTTELVHRIIRRLKRIGFESPPRVHEKSEEFTV